ncbi:MAG TPA: glycosyltransferase family 2 protein [Candidatus Acidoferrales bacterium]|nr:glycosyltransferase family 2 protein [Candidatus Acidoferrales bacterium]
MKPSISIIIATSGRVEKIERLLDSLSRTLGRDRIPHEIVIANNATDDARAAGVEALARKFDGRDGVRCWQVREPVAGKCRAQNKTIPLTGGEIVAFLDDDVEVRPEWLESIDSFFKNYPHDAMQGSVIMRPEDQKNEKLQKALYRYRTVDFVNYRSAPGSDLRTLTGGNMALRRGVFEGAGMFDERLGPGGFGISEDVEFAQRVLKAGLRIGWEPKAAVYNELDPSRLNEEAFRLRHEAQGRSRLAYKGSSVLSIIPNLMRSLWTFGWYSLLGNERRKYRAKGRYFHYRAMLQEKMKTSTGSHV